MEVKLSSQISLTKSVFFFFFFCEKTKNKPWLKIHLDKLTKLLSWYPRTRGTWRGSACHFHLSNVGRFLAWCRPVAYSQPYFKYLSGGAKWKNLPNFGLFFLIFFSRFFPILPLFFPSLRQFFCSCIGYTTGVHGVGPTNSTVSGIHKTTHRPRCGALRPLHALENSKCFSLVILHVILFFLYCKE